MGSPNESSAESGPDQANVATDVVKDQKITFQACFLGTVASLGGFMFGYVR